MQIAECDACQVGRNGPAWKSFRATPDPSMLTSPPLTWAPRPLLLGPHRLKDWITRQTLFLETIKASSHHHP